MDWNYYIHLDGFAFIYVSIENHVGIVVPPDADMRNLMYVNALHKALSYFDVIETFIQVRDTRHEWYGMENPNHREREIDKRVTIDRIKKLMGQKKITMPSWLPTFLHDMENDLPPLEKPLNVRIPRRGTDEGFVYLIESPDGYYKIGRTKSPNNRRRTFEVKLPFPIDYICTIATGDMYKLESRLHERFADKRVNGEWFALSPEDVDYIKGLSS